MDYSLLASVIHSLDKHKADELVALDVSALTSITDHFVIATGTGATQVRSLADYLEEELGREGIRPLRSEGYRTADWVTLDYADVIVHIFTRETREFYDLERLWADAVEVDIRPYMVES